MSTFSLAGSTPGTLRAGRRGVYSPAWRMCAATLALPPGHVFRQLLSAGHTPGDLLNALPHLEHDPGSLECCVGQDGNSSHGTGSAGRLAASASHSASLLREWWGGRIPGEGSAEQHRAVPDPFVTRADGQEGYPSLSAAPSASLRIRSGNNSKEQCRMHVFTMLQGFPSHG